MILKGRTHEIFPRKIDLIYITNFTKINYGSLRCHCQDGYGHWSEINGSKVLFLVFLYSTISLLMYLRTHPWLPLISDSWPYHLNGDITRNHMKLVIWIRFNFLTNIYCVLPFWILLTYIFVFIQYTHHIKFVL